MEERGISIAPKHLLVMIKYDRMFALFKERGYNMNRIRQENVIGQGTLTAIRQGKGGLTHNSIDKLCAFFSCQPGDLMEYIPDEPEEQ